MLLFNYVKPQTNRPHFQKSSPNRDQTVPVKVTRIRNHSLTQSNLWQACHPVPVICSCCYLSNRWQTNTCEQKTCHSGSHSNTFTQSFLELEVTRGWKNSFQKSLHHTVLFLPPSPSFCSISPPTFPPDSWMRHTQEYQELPTTAGGTKPPCLLCCVSANEFITRAAHTARSWNVHRRVGSTASPEPWQKSSEIKVQLRRLTEIFLNDIEQSVVSNTAQLLGRSCLFMF